MGAGYDVGVCGNDGMGAGVAWEGAGMMGGGFPMRGQPAAMHRREPNCIHVYIERSQTASMCMTIIRQFHIL